MSALRDDSTSFQHIEFRDVVGQLEPHVRGTALSVWEIAWLGQAYSDDPDAIAEHTGASLDLIKEGLLYAREHRAEIDKQIVRHTERPLGELLEMFPGMLVVTVGPDGSIERHA